MERVVAEAVIPRVFHFIWLGSPAPPERWRFCWESWARYHPTWSVRWWTDENCRLLAREPCEEDPGLPKAFWSLVDPRQRADVLRYVILYLVGGVYVDLDFECLQPLDPLLDNVDAFAASEDGDSISIGIIGSRPKHLVLRSVVDELPATLATPTAEIGEQTGPRFFTRVVRESGMPFLVFPRSMFYPYGGELARRGVPFNRVGSDAYAVHYWASINQCTP